MVFFKSCSRCRGDRVLDRDYYGWYLTCLQCGNVTYPEVANAKNRKKAS